jgi:hypothetical protein
MTDEIEKSAEVTAIEIRKLNLKTNDVLLLTAPKEWSPRQIAVYGKYLRLAIEGDAILKPIKILLIPHGMEASVISPSGGFVE